MQTTLSLSNFSIKTQNRQGGKNDENLHSHCQKEQLCILRHYIMKKNLFSFQDSNSLKEKKFPFNCNNHFVLKTLDILHFKVVLHKRPSSIYKNYKEHLHQKTKSTEKNNHSFYHNVSHESIKSTCSQRQNEIKTKNMHCIKKKKFHVQFWFTYDSTITVWCHMPVQGGYC